MTFLKIATALVAVLSTGLAAPTPEVLETSAASKFCDDTTGICYSEYAAPGNIAFRIAIPDTATAAPFDILFSIVAPKAIGWAGIAWGGVMANNPLTIGWANGASATVSSRRATGHVLPAVYAGASYTVLPGSVTNATHWRLDVLCSGCSQWTDASSKAVALSPASTGATFAWASSTSPPADPASNSSRFSIHSGKGKWSHDLNSAKIANFAELVQKAKTAKPAML